jgi:isoquinoline 1-oxidoreductase subunit beta
MSALEKMRGVAAPHWEKPSLTEPDPMQLINIDTILNTDQFTKSKNLSHPRKDAKRQESADILSTSSTTTRTIDIRLDIPLASHAFIEPRCTVAMPRGQDGLELWTGTQDPFYVRDVIQRDTGLKLEKIIVHPMRIGGAFGGKTIASVEREASLIALALGRPVKVQWSRTDEFQGGFHRQPSSHRIRASMNSAGLITDWRHSLSTAHVLFTNAVLPPWLQALTDLVGDDGAARGHTPVYAFAHQRLDLKLTRLPVLTGPWRGLGAGPNVLAIEMAMDAAARLAEIDPLEFRLKHLKLTSSNQTSGDPSRVAQCLIEVSRLALTKPLLRRELQDKNTTLDSEIQLISAQGMACGAYKGLSYAAAVAEVVIGLNKKGQVRFVRTLKLWCAHDCGQMVNVQSVEAQVQGNLVWSIGMILKERLDARQGTPEQTNFAQYSIPLMSDVPEMEILLMASDAAPSGAGETAIVAGAGAIANALTRALIAAGLPAPTNIPFQL